MKKEFILIFFLFLFIFFISGCVYSLRATKIAMEPTKTFLLLDMTPPPKQSEVIINTVTINLAEPLPNQPEKTPARTMACSIHTVRQ